MLSGEQRSIAPRIGLVAEWIESANHSIRYKEWGQRAKDYREISSKSRELPIAKGRDNWHAKFQTSGCKG